MHTLGILGYFSAVLMGLVLGLIGGGGSILTVPILIYLFGIGAAVASRYSLLVVGVCSLIGSYSYFQRKLVDLRTALLFALPAFLGVALSRRILLPALPEAFRISHFTISKDLLILMSFAAVMLLAALSMIRSRGQAANEQKLRIPFVQILTQGFGVGAITGFVGAGGGFLIVPALVELLKLPMSRAVGTSLVIISANSLFGFFGDYLKGAPTEWGLLMPVLGFATIGIFLGTYLNRLIPNQKLKPLFGWFVLFMGGMIFLKELWVFLA
jgi:uncharacterized membrane protein YfcA